MSKQVRNHKWDKNDSILTLYFVKFGLLKLPVEDEKEFAEWIIGSSEASLTLQSLNVRHLLGHDEYTLTDYSKFQEEAVNEYCDLSEEDLREIVLSIIDDRDVEQNIADTKAKKVQAQVKAKLKKKEETKRLWKEESDRKLEETLRRMGKDPSKMKRLVRK
tara:strand:+ start:5478 stop:5960 length:483 start_codon:yes stop_codon:yes gene_type:complete